MKFQLDFKEMHAWPITAKVGLMIVVFAVCLGAGYWFLISPALSAHDRVVAQERLLSERLAIKQQQQPDIKTEKAKLAQMKQKLAHMLKQLPNEQEIPALVEHLAKAAQQAKLDVESIKPMKLKQLQTYQLLPIEVSIKGGYPEIQSFIKQLSKMERIVEVGNFELKPVDDKNPEKLTMKMTVNTFVYKPLEKIKKK